ncbi:hypothetical protein [Aureimonas sp. SK2]|uniref:hypothetical protein n=1 Tax=Aureimonas sp. SK2 TaxID=3015992 RepID=UPI002443D1CE|nr:hypothetical protein [Aureimonas sp. SK2]
MDTLTTSDIVATQPRPEEDDVLSAFALAPSEPDPEIEERTFADRLEDFLKLARAH